MNFYGFSLKKRITASVMNFLTDLKMQLRDNLVKSDNCKNKCYKVLLVKATSTNLKDFGKNIQLKQVQYNLNGKV